MKKSGSHNLTLQCQGTHVVIGLGDELFAVVELRGEDGIEAQDAVDLFCCRLYGLALVAQHLFELFLSFKVPFKSSVLRRV